MEVIDIFKDSLIYPSKDWIKVLILGILMLVPVLFVVFPVLAVVFNQFIGAVILGMLFVIVFLILYLIVCGYSLSVIKETINDSEECPEFQWVKNLIDGIKYVVVSIAYSIIPILVTLLLAYVTGFFENFVNILNYTIATQGMYGSSMSTATSGTVAIPPELIVNLWGSALIVAIVGIVLFIIFGLLLNIAIARLAKTDNLGDAFSFGEIFEDIANIGWGTYIIWTILLIVISFIFTIITSLVQMIPIIGSIVAVLLISPYILIFGSRALGLIYNESKS